MWASLFIDFDYFIYQRVIVHSKTSFSALSAVDYRHRCKNLFTREMCNNDEVHIQIHPIIQQIIRINYKFGVWQNEDASLVRKFVRTVVYVSFSIGFVVSLIGGSLIADDYHESLFLLTSGLIVSVLIFRTFLNYSSANQVLAVLQAVCVHSISKRDKNQLLRNINRKLNFFKNFSFLFVSLIVIIALTFLLLFFPAFLTKKQLPFSIWFPLDWKNSSIAHWMAYFYIISCLIFNSFICLLTLIVWYIMLNCAIKYEVLGDRFRHFGAIPKGKKIKRPSLIESIELIRMFQQLET